MKELATALVAIQRDLPTVGKGKENPFFHSKYVDLVELQKAVLPVTTKHGVAIIQLPDNVDGQSALTTILLHESGESLQGTFPLKLVKDDPQAQGSAITYARRYGIMAALGIVGDEDDDGIAASNPKEASSDRPASDKQKKFIGDLYQQKTGKDPTEVVAYIESEYSWVAKDLTADQASHIIEDLQAS